MKHSALLFLALFLLLNCTESTVRINSIVINNNEELLEALKEAEPGDKIVMANGEYNDLQIKIATSGTAENRIVLAAETPGKVMIRGKSNLQLGGDYITVDGLYFNQGASPSRSVITYAIGDNVANHCIVTHCVIEDYNKSQRNFQDLWILLKGRHNQLDHCYLAGKSNRGPTIRVDLGGNQNINNHHKIINNHFGPRPPKGGPSAETIQIGDSSTSMCPSYTLVADNLFEECNGEVEVISSKTNFNQFRNNVFYKSEGSLVTRHGNYCIVDGNYFIGDESKNTIGGVRLIGTGHTVTNNYFYNLKGQEFRSPIAVMNGIPKSPLNRYIQVTDVIIAHNSWINCTSPLQFGVGSNVSQKDVLPASEIRSARPIRTVVANNLIHNTKGDKTPIVAHDKLDGILFKNNFIDNQSMPFDPIDGVDAHDFDLKEIEQYILIPTTELPSDSLYHGFGFEEFNSDLFGASRENNNAVGAIIGQPSTAPSLLDKTKYGTDWYFTNRKVDDNTGQKTHLITSGKSLADAINQASAGDIVEIEAGDYIVEAPLVINKTITLKSNTTDGKVNINYSGPSGTPLFEMNPRGILTIKNLHLIGNKTQNAFACLEQNMSSLYNLTVENCEIENFDYILKAYKFSFSEYITLKGSTFKNCNNGLELSAEDDDKGDYNAENIIIDQCLFDGIQANVVDYYRGGYDESTVGGTLRITKSTFTNCGAKEKNKTLLNTYGIINVDLSDNTFKNNRVQKVAQLWGAKNNSHSNNRVTNSGKIVVEENLKLKTFY